METFLDSLPYLIVSTGIILLFTTSAYGACYGVTLSATSSSLFTQKKNILTYAYLAVIMATSIYFFAVILFVVILSNITEAYKLEHSVRHFSACCLTGLIGYTVGITMGNISKNGFPVLYKEKNFSTVLILLFTTAEILIIFGFMGSLIIVFPK